MFLKNDFILLFFIIILCEISTLIIPLYPTKNISNAHSLLDIIDLFKNNMKYSYIDIGVPPQRFQIIFTSKESTNNIEGENCLSDSFYDLNISTTKQFNFVQNEQHFFYVKDFVSLDKSLYRDLLMNFVYYKSTITGNENCGYIGLGYADQTDEEYNLFFQLKKLYSIKKTIYYFNYTTNNEVLINIGLEPFEVDSSYSQNKTTIEVDPILDSEVKHGRHRKYDWNLNFSRIFYIRKLPLQTNIDPYTEISRMKTRKINFFQAILQPEDDFIKGPFEYQEAIDNDFFDKLISDNICMKTKVENKYYYYCKIEHKNFIKSTFPSLYFYQSDLNYMFELNYDDLFFEKENFIFFGIYFNCFQIEVFQGAFISEWTFGKIFLKKYAFGFDFQNHKLIFYKKNKFKKQKTEEKNISNENKSSNKKIYQLGLILIVITIGIFAFILERYARKKYRVNNLLIDFDNRDG